MTERTMTKLDRGKVAMLLASALGVTACYNPNISSNGLQCAAAPAKPCPDGFVCAGGACVKTGAVGAGGSGSGGANGSGGRVGSGGNTGTGGGVQPLKMLGEACLIVNQGQPNNQTDNCDTGLLCIDDCGGSSSRCYKTCESDGDCPQSSCTRSAPGGPTRLCEISFAMCNPQNPAASGCGAGLGCYLLSSEASASGGDRTVCDCSMSPGGMGDSCSDSRRCFPGLVCPPTGSGPGAEACWLICDPAAATSGCPAAHPMCRPFGAKWGYCY